MADAKGLWRGWVAHSLFFYRQNNLRSLSGLPALGRIVPDADTGPAFPESTRALLERGLRRTERYWGSLRLSDAALADFEEAQRREPGDPWAWLLAGLVHEMQRRYERGAASCDQAAARAPGWAWPHILRGICRWYNAEFKGCCADFQKALALEPRNVSALLFLSRAKSDLRDKSLVKDLDRALKLAPRSGLVLCWRGRAQYVLQKLPSALVDLRRACKILPGYDRGPSWLGISLLEAGRPKEALPLLRRAAVLNPSYPTTLYPLARAAMDLGRFAEAGRALRRACEVDRHGIWGEYRISMFHPNPACRRSIADLDRFLERSPRAAWALAWRGQTRLILQEYRAALADFDRAAALAPRDGWTRLWRAETLRRLGYVERARTEFEAALKLDKSLSWGWAGKGWCLSKIGRAADAAAAFDRAEALAPRAARWTARWRTAAAPRPGSLDETALHAWARERENAACVRALEAGDFAGALRAAGPAQPAELRSYLLRAWLQLRSGDAAASVETASRALCESLDPIDPAARQLRAQAKAALGEAPEADAPSVPSEDFDLIVVGGGPAGSTLSGLVRKYHPGRRVLVLEKASFPRHHVGESLLPGMIPVLKELGVFDTLNAAGFPRKIGAAFVWGKDRKPWDADFNNLNLEMIERYGRALDTEFSWQVVRSKYDDILLRHAAGLGAEVRHGWRAVAPLERDGRVVGVLAEAPDGTRHELRAGITADCSGQNSFLGPHRGTRAYNEDLKNVASYAYFRGARWKFEYQGHPDKTKIFICSAPEGWFWYIPVEKDLVSVGLVSKAAQLKAGGADPRARFFAAVKGCPEIAPLLEGARLETGMDPAQPAKDFFNVGDWSFTSEHASGPGWLAAGDAAFFLDPLLSSGVMMAHLSGHKAAYTVGTAWAESDPAAQRALWEDYDRFCREVAGAFGALVLYWYRHDPSTESWWKLARETMAAGTGLDLEDRMAFTTIAAGLHYYFERAYTTQSLLFAPIGKEHAWQWEGSKHDLKRWSRQVLAVVETGFLAPDSDNDPAVREAAELTALAEIPDAWVPAWSSERRLSVAFLPEPGAGRLRPIRRMDFERPGKPPARRLLPKAYLDALALVDGRRSFGEIRAALLASSPLPADLVAGQLFRILKDLAVLGALTFEKGGTGRTAGERRGENDFRRGEAALKAGDPASAAGYLDAAIAAGGAPAWAFALRGEARRHLGRPQEADDDLKEALRLAGAPAAQGASRLDDGVAAFEADIRRGWLEDRIHIYRGKLRLERGDATGARADAETALRANPKHSEALLLRARAARLLGEPEAARNDLLTALAVENSGRKGEG